MILYDEFERVVIALQATEVQFAVCGGIAVALHGFVRATDDIDLLIQQADVDRAKEALAGCGFILPALPMTFRFGKPGECRVHRISKIQGEDHLTVDLLTVEPSYVDVWSTRVELSWKARKLPVVSREGLAKMKRLSGRHQDLADLERLGFTHEP
jgi:hypothetical protein